MDLAQVPHQIAIALIKDIVWVMISYFEGVPQELKDAARVDGAST